MEVERERERKMTPESGELIVSQLLEQRTRAEYGTRDGRAKGNRRSYANKNGVISLENHFPIGIRPIIGEERVPECARDA